MALYQRLDGKVAKNKHGQIGIITDNKSDTYFGMSLDGKLVWSGLNPTIISDSLFDFMTKELYDALDKPHEILYDAVVNYLGKVENGLKRKTVAH